MDAMGIIGWIVLGGLAGWVASMISKENGGLLKNIIVGIIGAFLGGFVFSTLGGSEVTGFNFYSFIVALVGALILIFLLRLVTGRSKA